jgi:hypothetical protein
VDTPKKENPRYNPAVSKKEFCYCTGLRDTVKINAY